MGLSKDYSNVPEWIYKAEGYDPIRDKREIKVKYQGNIFKANYWAGKEPGVDPGWELYDELYDQTAHTPTGQAKIIAYIPTWKKQAGFNYAMDEMYRYITHGIISFLMFDENKLGEFTSQSLNDVNAIIADVVTVGHRNGVKVSIALGGATDYGFLHLMTAIGNNPGTPLLDQAVQKVVEFVQSNNLDGVDLDLECWWDANGNPRNDQGGRIGPHPAGHGLTAFAKRLREAMPNKLLSAAFFASSWYGNNYQLIDYVDWIGVMTYDLTGSWNNSPVGPHTALYKICDQKVYEAEQQGSWPLPNPESTSSDPMRDNPIQSVEEALWYWTNPFYVNWQGAGQKMPRSKFVGGVPLYGYDFSYPKSQDEFSGQVPPGYKTITYKDILTQFPNASIPDNGNIKMLGGTPRPPFTSASGSYPYTHNIYFETPDTAVTKLKFLKDMGAQGVIIWELTNDVWKEESSIIKALYKNSGNLQKQVSAEELTEGSTIDPQKALKYETGKYPSVAINDLDMVVEVHEGADNDDLCYRVGEVDKETNRVDWKSTQPDRYTTGHKPSVAINNSKLVVAAHQGMHGQDLAFRIGAIVTKPDKTLDIVWKKEDSHGNNYERGSRPSVAINNNGLVVEVHAGLDKDQLCCIIGKVSKDKAIIEWEEREGKKGQNLYEEYKDKDTKAPLDKVKNLSVAVNDSNLVAIVYSVIHITGKDYLYICFGEIKANHLNLMPYEESTSKFFDAYTESARITQNLSIAINNRNQIVEVHEGTDNQDLCYQFGKFYVNSSASDKRVKVTWEPSNLYAQGKAPKIACNTHVAVEVHHSGDAKPDSDKDKPVNEPF
jgi:GH18 family chitinase